MSSTTDPSFHPHTVIFDFGGVLIDWNPRYVFRSLFETEEQMEWFFDNVCTPEWNEEQDAGYPIAQAIEERIALWPDYADLIRAYYGCWVEMLGGPLEETVTVLKELKDRGTPLYGLTNWSAETFPYVWENEPYATFLHWFDGIVVSGRVGLKKPDPAIYHVLFDRYNLNPEEALFIDDNARNVAAAEATGLHVWHFTDAASLRAELVRLDLL